MMSRSPLFASLLLILLSVACGGGSGSSSNSGGNSGGGGNPGGGGSTGGSVDVLTQHNDNARTGANLAESKLTTANVNQANFGKVSNFSVDGRVDAQPLYVSSVAVPSNGTHNLLIVATEHDSVFAFDADSGTIIWQKSMLASGESPSDARNCSQVSPEIGVTATPVIDRSRGANGTIYLVAMSKNGSAYHHRLHALDLATGADLMTAKEIQASFPGTGDGSDGSNVIFDAKQYKERAALLLMGGVVYTSWASHCDIRPYTGWIMAYNADTLAQTSVLNVTPNGNTGAIWMAGAGLAGDSSGHIFFLDANGTFDTTLNGSGFPVNKNFGNAFMNLSTSGGTLAVADYFEMHNGVDESNADQDLGSGGAMVLPDLMDGSGNTKHLAVGVGKDAHVYVVDRDNMGKFNSNSNNIYQDVTGALSGGVFAMPAYFNNRVYYGAVGDFVKAFSINNAKLSTSATSQTTNSFGYPGSTPSISANGTSNGIVWAVENGGTAVLHAYDATNLNEIYNSNQASNGRDHFGAGNKYITPTIVNGKVFVGTTNSVAVFGLLQ
jgi:hypothetical protein